MKASVHTSIVPFAQQAGQAVVLRSLILYVTPQDLLLRMAAPGTEPVFLNLFRSPGIDSQPGGSVRQPYLMYRTARLHRLAESIPWNRLQGSLNFNKYGLCNTLHEDPPLHSLRDFGDIGVLCTFN
jgi:hypothetical protein